MGYQSKLSNAADVVDFLKTQHEHVKALFEQVIAATGNERKIAFTDLRRTLAVHETAEEEIVHPAARRKLSNGDAIVAKHLREENEAKTALTEIEKLDVDSREFDEKIRALQTAVIAHAESEEQNEFSKLGDALEPARLQRMRRAVQFAEAVAPTRPHAGIESASANMLVGPFAMMLDRARDALASKS